MNPQTHEEPPGEDIFGAPWPEDPRLQEQQSLEAEPDVGTLSEEGGVNESSSGDHGQQMSPVAEPGRVRDARTSPPAESAPTSTDHEPIRSAVKITKTTRGTTFEVRVLAGDPEELLNRTREIAVSQYQALERELP